MNREQLIISELGKLNEAQLQNINSAVVGQLKAIRHRNASIVKRTLKPGDDVSFGDKGAGGKRSYKEGKLVRIKRTRAEVKVGPMTWTVPLNMLSKV
jgi:hypothetical protein